jgi:puromycin-sensitive aminopeptidase
MPWVYQMGRGTLRATALPAERPSPTIVTTDPYRLPRTVLPSRYELTLEPDLPAARFTGECTTEVEVVEATDEILLNAVELEILEAWVEAPGTGGRRIAAEVRLEPETERAHLLLGERLTPGGWFVVTRFQGDLNDQLHGFYRSSFTDDAGVEHRIATTQMEATHARRAFPCWDEPELKAVFAVTLVVDPDLLALSNAFELHRTPLDDGRVAVQFADTMVMSTYLVAFVVGPMEVTDPLDVGNVPLRISHRPGKGHLTPYAKEVGAFALSYFEDYFGIVYPGGKLDLVAIPDFAFGAMENTGCVTFREVLLLVDPDAVTQPEQQNVVDVISHEIAHMWFGNLVTMRWWNGIWLNEAFATFMETKCTDAFRPDWERWVTFGHERAAAFDVDALTTTRPIEYEVVSPEDAEGMFDVLTYEKGGAVLRMLEQYLGEERFRDGVRAYLHKHQFANTETTDLWDAIEQVTDEPVRRLMDSWIFQGGFPVVHVEPTDDGIRLRQERFLYLDDGTDETRWIVPVVLRHGGAGAQQVHKLLLDDETAEVELPGAEWVHVNWGASGFYRVRYSPELLDRLVERIELLGPGERYAFADDLWAAVLAGHTPAIEFVELAEASTGETDVAVWQRLIGGLRTLDTIVDGETRAALQQRVLALLQPARDRMRSEPPTDDRGRQLRASLFESAAELGNDPEAAADARMLWNDELATPGSVDPALLVAAIDVIASRGDEQDFEAFWQRYRAAGTPQEELRFLGALADFDESDLFARLLAVTITDDVRTQNAPYILRRALHNRANGAQAWAFVRDNWDEINDRFPSNSIVRLLEGVRSLHDPAVADDVFAFFDDHVVPQGARTLAQHLERLRVNVALREREATAFSEALLAR